jgi:hypothetical protein
MNLLEFIGIYWNLLEFIGIYWNLLEFIGIYWNLLEFAMFLFLTSYVIDQNFLSWKFIPKGVKQPTYAIYPSLGNPSPKTLLYKPLHNALPSIPSVPPN